MIGFQKYIVICLLVVGAVFEACAETNSSGLTLSYEKPHWLIISHQEIPHGEIRINYLEAYCRAGSTESDWIEHTVIPHRPELVSTSDDGKIIRLRDTLSDGVTVDHTITASSDEVLFKIVATNPTSVRSEAHWAQPCIRLGNFTGYPNSGGDLNDYLPKGFIFLDGKLTSFPHVKPWALKARYVPGQVWCPTGVPRADVNPRPLSPLVPSHGLIGCFSSDNQMVFGVAFEPYQELFQGVARCLHSDFRLGGLEAGEVKKIRGKIYLLSTNADELFQRYLRDFPEHQ